MAETSQQWQKQRWRMARVCFSRAAKVQGLTGKLAGWLAAGVEHALAKPRRVLERCGLRRNQGAFMRILAAWSEAALSCIGLKSYSRRTAAAGGLFVDDATAT